MERSEAYYRYFYRELYGNHHNAHDLSEFDVNFYAVVLYSDVRWGRRSS